MAELRHLYGEAIHLINIIARIQSEESLRSSLTECHMAASPHVLREPDAPDYDVMLSSCDAGTLTPIESERASKASSLVDGKL